MRVLIEVIVKIAASKIKKILKKISIIQVGLIMEIIFRNLIPWMNTWGKYLRKLCSFGEILFIDFENVVS